MASRGATATWCGGRSTLVRLPHRRICTRSIPRRPGAGTSDPLGITSNLVADAATGVVFAVGEVVRSPGAQPAHEIVGVNAATLERWRSVRANRPARDDASGA